MRLGFAAFSFVLVLPLAGAACAADELANNRELLHVALQQDETGSPAQHPPLVCGMNDYAFNASGRKITVRDADGLKAAMQNAKAGDVIELGPGDYGWVTFSDLNFSDYVKLKGTDGARVKHLGLTNVKNLHIEGVHFEYGSAEGEDWKPKMLEMRNSQNIRIINSDFMGNRNTTTWGSDIPDTGIRAYDHSKDIVIAGTTFRNIMRAVMFQQVNGYNIENNSLTDIGCDGLFFQNSSNGRIENNYLSDFRPFIYAEQGKTCHADFIQFDAGKGRNTMTPSSNVVIRGNVMLQGQDGSSCRGVGSVCGAVQGIFLGGATGKHPKTGQEHKFADITISDNMYCASGMNGLFVSDGRNIRIVNNAHYSCPPPFGSNHVSRIALRGSQIGSTVSGNTEKRVSSQMEAVADAKKKGTLNNCVVANM
jgi:parallel beta-helix repeat protein